MFPFIIASLLLLNTSKLYSETQPDQDLVKTYLTNKTDHESLGAIKLVKFKKTDGIHRTEAGQGWYDMHFNITIQPTRDIWKAGRTCWYDFGVYTAKPTGWDEHVNGGTIAYTINQTIKLTGVAQCLQMGEKWVVDRVSFTEAGAPAATANTAPVNFSSSASGHFSTATTAVNYSTTSTASNFSTVSSTANIMHQQHQQQQQQHPHQLTVSLNFNFFLNSLFQIDANP